MTDARWIYTQEATQYWLGRYTSILDHVRTQSLISPTARDSKEYDSVQRTTKEEALTTLRSFCQTSAASNSFEQFHMSLSQRDPDLWSKPTQYVSTFTIPDSHINPAKSRTRKLSGALSQNMFRKTSATLSTLKIGKSATMNNLSSHESISSTARLPELEPNHQRHESSHIQMPERQSFLTDIPTSHAARPQNRSQPNTCTSRPQTNIQPVSSQHIQRLSAIPRRSSISGLKRTPSDSSGGSSTTGTENGNKTRADLNSIVEETTVGHSRRFRKSESMKRLVDASISGLKKMGHRVSNTGVSTSDDC